MPLGATNMSQVYMVSLYIWELDLFINNARHNKFEVSGNRTSLRMQHFRPSGFRRLEPDSGSRFLQI